MPCDPTGPHCPSGQTCVAIAGAYVCGAPDDPSTIPGQDAPATPADAASESSIPIELDTDLDGLADSSDNCVAIPNPDQFNEDGDSFGDLCDPCPPIADDQPLDSDSDGVADACDPRPLVSGDRISLFEGFHEGVPAAWYRVGTWNAGNDAVTIDLSGANDFAYLTLPTPSGEGETVSASITVDALAANTATDASVGLVEMFKHTTGEGVYCHLTRWTSSTPIAVTQLKSAGAVKDTSPYELTPGETYRLRYRRDSTTYSCDGARGIASASAQLTSTLTNATPEVGLRISNAKATFAWLLIVSR
ncbi:MAG: hypothetical protein AB7P03_28855 [Kofleriaceae bacterium]